MSTLSRRIILSCWGSYGDLYPYIGLAKALTARGHRPRIVAARYYQPAVEQEGIDFAAAGVDVDPNDAKLIARIMDPAGGTEVIFRELLLPGLQAAYDDLAAASGDADLIVSHPVTFAAPILAQKRGLPWISTVLAPMSFFSTTDLPVFPPMPRLVHLRRLGPWVGRLMVGMARRITRDWMEPIYRLRADLGLPRGGDPLYEGQFSPTLTLALFSKTLATPQPDWPPDVETTGFVFYNGSAGLDPVLSRFLDAGPAPIVFTLGSSAVGAAGRFYQESADAVASLGMRAVLLTGGFPQNLPAVKRPDDVLVIDRAPHQLLFPRAAAVVHQGGIGTTAQALRAGHPMMVVPHGHDQPDNAFRVKNLGVSQTIFPPQYRAPRVARTLRRILGDARYRERAAAVAMTVKAEGGAEAAALAVEQAVARSTK